MPVTLPETNQFAHENPPWFPGFHTIKMVDFPASELLVYRSVFCMDSHPQV